MNAIWQLSRSLFGVLFHRLIVCRVTNALLWFTLTFLFFQSGRANTFVSAGDFTEPTQKAIIVYEHGREDLILQAKYEGTASEFAWIIPVPGLPEVKSGSMESFYAISRITQQSLWPEEFDWDSMTSSRSDVSRIKKIQISTSKAVEVAILSPAQPQALHDWLAGYSLVIPKEKRSRFDQYIEKHWYFVAAWVNFRIGVTNPLPALPPSEKENVSTELEPIVISFSSDKCIYPLALSASNAAPSSVAAIVLSSEPLMSRAIFEKKFAEYCRNQEQWRENRVSREKAFHARTNASAVELGMQIPGRTTRNLFEDPDDPRPPMAVFAPMLATYAPSTAFSEADDDFPDAWDLVKSMAVDSKALSACTNDLPRLSSKSCWLTRQTETIAPGEMSDLEFEPAVPLFTEKIRTSEGRTLAQWLPQFGSNAVPFLLGNLNSTNPSDRKLAAPALRGQISDSRLVPVLANLLKDSDPRIRASACYAARANWDSAFAPKLVELLSDSERSVGSAAYSCLLMHPAESANYVSDYQKILADNRTGALYALNLLKFHHAEIPKSSFASLLSSSDPCVIEMATWGREPGTDEIAILYANPLPMARLKALGALLQSRTKPAMDKIVTLLRDPDEGIRWTVRQNLRRLSGLRLGAKREAWENWWTENRENFTFEQPNPAGFKKR